MKRTLRLSVITWIIILGAIGSAAVVWGSDVSTSLWRAKATLANAAGEDVSNAIFPVPLDVQTFIDNGFINATGLNMDIHNSVGNDVPFAPGSLITRMLGAVQDDGPVYTDFTTEANDAAAGDVKLIPDSLEIGDQFYFIADSPFRVLRINIDSVSTCSTPMEVAWEYKTPTGPYVAVTGLQDGTAAFQKLGTNTVSFDFPTDPPFNTDVIDGITGFSVRARTTAGVCTEGPNATQIWYSTGVMWVFEDDLASGSSLTHDIFAGGSVDQRTTHRIITGNGGFEFDDDPALEPDLFDIDLEIKGYWDFGSTAAGPSGDRDLFHKGGDISIRKDNVNDGEMFATFTYSGSNCDLNATGLPNGVHTLLWEVRPAAGTCRLLVDTVETVTDGSVTGLGIADNASSFEVGDHNVLNYMDFFKYSLGGVLLVHFEPVALEDALTIRDRELPANDGEYRFYLPAEQDSSWNGGHTAALAPFLSTIEIGPSPNAGAGSDVVSDVSGSAEGTGFAGVSAPNSGLPGYTFLSDLAGKDYDPVLGGVQGIPISFFYIVIAAAILIATLVGILVMTRSLFFAAIAVGLMAALMVSVTIVSPWYLMWLAIPMALYFLVRGGIEL